MATRIRDTGEHLDRVPAEQVAAALGASIITDEQVDAFLAKRRFDRATTPATADPADILTTGGQLYLVLLPPDAPGANAPEPRWPAGARVWCAELPERVLTDEDQGEAR